MIGTQLFAVVHDNTHLNLALYTRNIKASLHKMIQEPLSALFSLHPSQAKPSQRQTPISVATMGPSSTNRIFGTRRTVVVLVLVVLSLVTYSLVSISYSSMVAYVPNFSSQKNQTNKVIMAAAMKQPNAEIIPLSSPSVPQSRFVEVAELPAVEESPTANIDGIVEPIHPRLATITTTTEAKPIVHRLVSGNFGVSSNNTFRAPQVYGLTYGTALYENALNRIKREADESELFKSFKIGRTEDLDASFVDRFRVVL
jgi:hypothetical protein